MAQGDSRGQLPRTHYSVVNHFARSSPTDAIIHAQNIQDWPKSKTGWTHIQAYHAVSLMDIITPALHLSWKKVGHDLQSRGQELPQAEINAIVGSAARTGETIARSLTDLQTKFFAPRSGTIPALALKQCQLQGCGIWNHPGQISCLHCHRQLPGIQCLRPTCLKWNTAPDTSCSACTNTLPDGTEIHSMAAPGNDDLKRCPKTNCGQWNWIFRRYCRLCSKSLPSRRCGRFGCGHWNNTSTRFCLLCRLPFIKGNNATPTFLYPLPCVNCKTDDHASAECSTAWVIPQVTCDMDEQPLTAITEFDVSWTKPTDLQATTTATGQRVANLINPREILPRPDKFTDKEIQILRQFQPQTGIFPDSPWTIVTHKP